MDDEKGRVSAGILHPPPPSMLASSRCLSLSVSMTDTEPDLPLSSSQSMSTTSASSDSRFHVSVAGFTNYARQLMEPINEISCDGFDEELEELHRRCMAANLKQHIYIKSLKMTKKNRYSDILPYAHTRVVLSEIEKIPDSDYINANYLKAHLNGCSTTYISTQAPIPSTISDFWRMIWEQKSLIVIMLTPLLEKNMVKSDIYWPRTLGKSKQYDNGIEICLKSEGRSPDVITRLVEIRYIRCPNEIRTITHIQYLGWPDHSVPISFESYLSVFSLYRSLREKSTGPVVVHCSAGIGRTGTFIGVDMALDAFFYILKHGQPTDTICLLDIVYNMRTQRPGMVQTKEQYQFMYAFLGYCLERQHFNLRL